MHIFYVSTESYTFSRTLSCVVVTILDVCMSYLSSVAARNTKNAPGICRTGDEIILLPDYADSPCLTAGISILGQEVVGNAGGPWLPVFGLEKNIPAASNPAITGVKPLSKSVYTFFEALNLTVHSFL
jgi:hypothetical protein